jgi:2-amino-4-hydroxy-6-hydroxymethyldihydropteridine diphosphokinase
MLVTSFTLLLGSNQGNRVMQLNLATDKITHLIGPIIKVSSVYETAAWGKHDQPDFLNQSLVVSSTLNPVEVLQKIQSIESEMGRTRVTKWGERTIDIDILYANDCILDLPQLKIPHPEIQNRRFTLIALTEIDPDFIHPTLQKNHRDLYNDCLDNLPVKLFIS